ncbi:hypothetical protein H2204_014068 [Knufia peltigerae]|uniref:Uncharacterized protein n=1 Tax=Knufia peltigerae TaxID=1002370 RepID=A0AA38XNE0_9EURO|nr:hypothetical protein H2204_014068 [Knufia peltigerae]
MGSPIRSDFIEADMAKKEPSMTQTMSNGAVSMSPELFEKLYLTPKIPRAGDNIKRFANPTPLGFAGFVIADMTFAMVLMGWGGASGLTPVVGIFFFVGPILLLLACVFEWIMGNFFPMVAFGVLAVFWLSFGMLQLPTLNLDAPYASTNGGPSGALSSEFNAVIALYLIVWGFALLTFLVLSLRTNMVFVMMFVSITAGAWVLSGAYWKLSTGDLELAGQLQKAGGALIFVTGVLAWYMTIVMMAAEMQYPFFLPVGDLSHYWERGARRRTPDHEA